jgi:flagellin
MVSFSIPKLFADGLGDGIITGQNLSTVDVTRSGGAEEAIRIVDGAVKELAVLRGELGSFQKNFLESTVRSLGVAVENITSSESQIRDADVAKEMTEFTKIQVLRQSGMSVLAQAAQAPNAVLQLLQQ